MSTTTLTRALLLCAAMVLAGACGSDETGDDDDDVVEPIAESDPDVLAGYAPWERECILWIRGDCQKAVECDIGPASDCWDSDSQLRATCQEIAEGDMCMSPDPASFTSCRTRTEDETCQEYCDSTFCFNFCFYTCND